MSRTVGEQPNVGAEVSDDSCPAGEATSNPDKSSSDTGGAEASRAGRGDVDDPLDITDSNEEAMKAAIRDMATPFNLHWCPVPEPSKNRSVLYDKGVRFQEAGDNPNPRNQWWLCMASESCRKQLLKAIASDGIQIENVSTGNATRHLPTVHNISSNKTLTASSTRSVSRATHALQPVSITTRRMLADALDKRFFTPRYGPASTKQSDYVFEMAACMHPCLVRMSFLHRLCPERAENVKKLVEGKVLDLMTAMAEGAALAGGNEGAASSGATSSGTTSSAVPPPTKLKKVGSYNKVAAMSEQAAEKEAQHLLDSGIFDEMDTEPEAPLTIRQQCKQKLDAFVAAGQKEALKTKPVSLMHQYWASEGSRKYPNMARAARVLLSVPASSAVLERDFSTAGRLITASRSRIDSRFVQMVLFLNGSKGIIPDEIPVLTESQERAATPRRLSHPRQE